MRDIIIMHSPHLSDLTIEERKEVAKCFSSDQDEDISISMIKDLRVRLGLGVGNCQRILKEYLYGEQIYMFVTDRRASPNWNNITEHERQQTIECYHSYSDKEITISMMKDLRSRIYYGLYDCKIILQGYIDTLK